MVFMAIHEADTRSIDLYNNPANRIQSLSQSSLLRA
jgi:hypothetical protein